jgi:hypothetical protein
LNFGATLIPYKEKKLISSWTTPGKQKKNLLQLFFDDLMSREKLVAQFQTARALSLKEN